VQVRAAQLGVGAALVALCACQPPDPGAAPPPKYRLEGSLTQLMSLGYDEARIEGTGQDVALTFVRVRGSNVTLPDGGDPGTSEDYPLKVVYRYEDNDGGIPANTTVDLAEVYQGAQRGGISRNVLNDPRKNFPDILRGELYFDRFPAAGETVRGNFHVTFVNGIEEACGHTVYGDFTAKVQ